MIYLKPASPLFWGSILKVGKASTWCCLYACIEFFFLKVSNTKVSN